jgi:hypothetical protein
MLCTVRAGAGAVIRIYGSVEPEPKYIFKAPQHSLRHTYNYFNGMERFSALLTAAAAVIGAASGSISQRYGSGSGSRSFYHQAKIVRKTLIPTVL